MEVPGGTLPSLCLNEIGLESPSSLCAHLPFAFPKGGQTKTLERDIEVSNKETEKDEERERDIEAGL